MSKFSALAIAAALVLSPVVGFAQTAAPATKPAAPAAQVKVDCTKVENKTKAECKAQTPKK